jgi:hypothetical protein
MKAQGFYAVMWHDNAVKPQESQVVMDYDTWEVQPNTSWRMQFEVVPDFAHSFQGKAGQEVHGHISEGDDQTGGATHSRDLHAPP